MDPRASMLLPRLGQLICQLHATWTDAQVTTQHSVFAEKARADIFDSSQFAKRAADAGYHDTTAEPKDSNAARPHTTQQAVLAEIEAERRRAVEAEKYDDDNIGGNSFDEADNADTKKVQRNRLRKERGVA